MKLDEVAASERGNNEKSDLVSVTILPPILCESQLLRQMRAVAPARLDSRRATTPRIARMKDCGSAAVRERT